MSLLNEIRCPADLRVLSGPDLDALAAEIRDRLVTEVSRNGGHLGPNLGVVELTIALHRVFDSPRDSIVWDTGHQAYVHKMLTGRAGDFAGLRRRGGLSGYPSRQESEHDLVENSHASTALSYADGLARANRLQDRNAHVVAVIGDGALTGGMTWEAINNFAVEPDRPLIVVVNDNGRSYAPTVGGLADHLRELRSFQATQSMYENVGLPYIGPIDGHDRAAVESALHEARDRGETVVVHCVTQKGRGHAPAEQDERDCFHAVRAVSATKSGPSWTSAFSEELLAAVDKRPELVALTAAMVEPTGLQPLQDAHPDRVVDVGMAEQHAVTSAAGMAMGGLHPVFCVYATFLNRAFDQVLMDVGLHRLAVTFVLDRAGITGDDGSSHNGVWDLAAFRAVPGMRIAAPRDRATLSRLLAQALDVEDAPTMLRFPKGSLGADLPVVERFATDDLDNPVDVLVANGDEALVIAVGSMAGPCLDAVMRLQERGIGCTVVDPGWVQPVNPALVELARHFEVVVTVEDGIRAGGIGEATAASLRDAGIVPAELRVLGVPTRFLAHGSRAELLDECGLTAGRIADQIADAVTARAVQGTLDSMLEKEVLR
ncbi:1-deoxy-D-xylulose-5-phosphate synthase [Kibdelosporangium banguiense]|uniref:1-deoxy-D-xylulose-5-phosphate synthase n=1 Tax=Kibdelosporangium banguiense TaxID=1365924 RepID=A0ABS4TRY9_9PSEU|nr:1-deoxy-D-xylulose-5-phosphate synthase [Kibdelosporangium banguiense]MBP2327164.1 1-deoxy-D-xylulose-5-phosphate synthase [Kibdelosporangium banguiense]